MYVLTSLFTLLTNGPNYRILGPREHALLTSKPGDMMTLRLVNVEHAGLFHCCPLKTEGTSCALRNIHVTLMNAFKESPEPSTL